MYATIRRGKIKASSANELARRVNEGLVPALTQLPGFSAYYVLDSADDTVCTVTVFETQAEVEVANERALLWIRQNLTDLVSQPPEVFEGRVLVHAGL